MKFYFQDIKKCKNFYQKALVTLIYINYFIFGKIWGNYGDQLFLYLWEKGMIPTWVLYKKLGVGSQ